MQKLTLVAILAIGLAMASCNKPKEVRNDLGEQNKAVVDKFIQALITGDLKTVDNVLADDFKAYGASRSDSSAKTQYLEIWKHNWDSVFSTMKYNRHIALTESIKDGPVMGDWVLEWGDVSTTYKNGRLPVTFKFHAVYRVKDGKVNLASSFYNVADIMAQQGFKFVSPEDQKKEKPGK